MDSALDKDHFIAVILQNPLNAALLDALPALGLADAWLVAGCLFQGYWNLKSGRDPGDGIRDYDIFYFDGADLSWDAEDQSIQRATESLSGIGARIEIKNQARVHLWYGERFGPGYPPLMSARDGVDRFLIRCARVAIRRTEQGIELYAPDGLGDLSAGILRPNPLNYRPALFCAKSESYLARWPWLQIEDDIAP